MSDTTTGNTARKNGWFSRMFSPRSWKLQAKILVPLLLIITLSLGITWAIVAIVTSQAIGNQTRKNLVDLCSQASEQVGHLIEAEAKDMTIQSEKNVAVSAIQEMTKWDRAKKEAEYRKSLKWDTYKTTATSNNFYLTRSWLQQMLEIKNMKEIMVMDVTGMTFCATNQLSDPNNATDEWFKEAVKNYNEKGLLCTIRGPEYDDSSDSYDLYITCPIRRSGENTVYGWISLRYPTDDVFTSAIEFNERSKALGSDLSIAWASSDLTLVGIMETYRIGTNISANPKTGTREIKYHVDEAKDWSLDKDGNPVVIKTGKPYKTEPSSLVGQIERYKKSVDGYYVKLGNLDPKSKTYNAESAKLQGELRDSSFEYGVASTGASRAYSVELIGEHLGLGNLGFIFTRQSRAEFIAPVVALGYILFAIIIIVLLLSILIIILTSRSIINPILVLRGSLVEVSLGNYNIQVPVTTQDEVGDLATTFNQMLKDIRQYIVSDEERNVKDREISELIDTLSKLAAGDLTVRAEVSPDEIGALADSVNFLAEELQDKVQSEEAKDQQDRQIANLLSTVSEMSTGDMTQSAEVTADVLGAVADSVNYMGEQIRKILQDVSNVTSNISETSSNIIEASDAMSKDAREQQSIITDTSAAVDEMAISINQVSQSAESAAQAAENSAKIAEVGGKTVEEAVDAMNRIRGSVAEISKRIKKLGESSQEIGEIVNVISDIAAQTNMLALNAAIEAARAGEQGRGFSVVADAVRQLAERSTKSTKDITLLIRGIQSETSEAIKTMEDSTGEVVEGSKLAETARDRLEEIVNNSRQLADLISSISLSSRQQSRATEEVNKSMGLISTITNSSTRSILNAAQSVAQMSKLVEELGVAIKRFKI